MLLKTAKHCRIITAIQCRLADLKKRKKNLFQVKKMMTDTDKESALVEKEKKMAKKTKMR